MEHFEKSFYLRPGLKAVLYFTVFITGVKMILDFSIGSGGIIVLAPFLAVSYSAFAYSKTPLLKIGRDHYDFFTKPISGLSTIKFSDIIKVDILNSKFVIHSSTGKRLRKVYWINFTSQQKSEIIKILRENQASSFKNDPSLRIDNNLSGHVMENSAPEKKSLSYYCLQILLAAGLGLILDQAYVHFRLPALPKNLFHLQILAISLLASWFACRSIKPPRYTKVDFWLIAGLVCGTCLTLETITQISWALIFKFQIGEYLMPSFIYVLYNIAYVSILNSVINIPIIYFYKKWSFGKSQTQQVSY